MKKIYFLLILLMVFSGAIAKAADEVNTGWISGKLMIKDEGPMAEGSVLFFSDKTGPPPLENQYMRAPENITDTDSRGSFSTSLPEGKYYLGGKKHTTEKWHGPPREGDLFFISKDENGGPKIYIVRKDEHIDIGTLSEAVPYTKIITQEGITAIEGTVRDMHGNPVEDVVIFASMDKGPAFVSDYTAMEGKFIIRVHKGGEYNLMLMGKFGSVFPASGMTVSDDGKQVPAGINVNNGEVNSEVDITIDVSP